MIKFTTPQLLDMLALQNRLNTLDWGPVWRDQHIEWHRAAWMKCASIMEYIGWREEGKGLPDLVNIQMELVHLWSFSLSYALEATHAQVHTDDIYVAADSIRNDQVLAEDSLTHGFSAQVKLHGEMRALMNLVELMVGQCSNDQQVSPAITLELAEVVGLDADNMYRTFLAVRVMDVFNHEHKHEGNENMLVAIMKANPDWDSVKIYAEMCGRYGMPQSEASNDGA